MKKFSSIVLSIGLLSITLVSCTGNNDAGQQQVVVPTVQQQQPVQAAPVDTVAQTQAQTAAPAANAQAIPEAINTFVKQYFPGATIAGIEPDHDHGGLEYDIYLSDGSQIDFDANNQWDQVECRAKAVPAALIPQAIATYVKNSHQNMAIVKINREHYGYEIELANGLELNFDRSGKFMGMDD